VLAERGLLPRETMDYVPKFLAAQIVAKNYQRLGFRLNIGEDDRWEDWDTVSVPSGVRLGDLARKTNVPLAVLKRWNKDLLRGLTPASRSGTVEIYVPKTEVAKFDAARDEIAKLQRRVSPSDRQHLAKAGRNEDDYDFYVVRRGDNLSSISKHIGISTRTLMKINGLRRGRIHPGQRLKYYSAGRTAASERQPTPARAKRKKKHKKKRSRRD
jgi:membrane-bound lytic murein transglycosylase D